MNFVKTCLAVVVGVVIGASLMIMVHPQPVNAQGGTVFVQECRVEGGLPCDSIRVKGSRVVGFSCGSQTECFVASQ
jgi:hypothetical protein